MALINCPECGREISDQAPVCPNCGFPISEKADLELGPQKVDVASVSLSNNFFTKKRVILIVGIVLLAIASYFVYDFSNTQNAKISTNEYIDNLLLISEEMLDAGSDAEYLTNLTASVWRDAIYEERNFETSMYTTDDNGRFYSDFNDALNDLYTSSETLDIVFKLEVSQNVVQSQMKLLNNPPVELEDCYDVLIDLNTSYMSLTNLAISPQGSLQSYAQEKNDRVDNFVDNFHKLETLIPEKEEVPEFYTKLLGK